MSENNTNNIKNATERINQYTMRMNPNNYGQIIGSVIEVMPAKHKKNRKGVEYSITPLRLDVMNMGRSQEIVVLLYDCDYAEMLERGHVVQIMYHAKMRNLKLQSGGYACCTDLIADSVRVIALNIDIVSEYPDEYYDDGEDDDANMSDDGTNDAQE